MGFITLFGMQTISGCFTFTLLVGFPGGPAFHVHVEWSWGLRCCRTRSLACLLMHRDPYPPSKDSLQPKSPGSCFLPSQKPGLPFGNLGAYTVGLLPRPEICIKRLRKIHPKINMKAKTSCQELQPHTSCWLLLLPLSSQFWFF